MRLPRSRLRSLMILILVAGLIMGAGYHLARLDFADFDEIPPRRFYFMVPFLLLVAMKLGLAIVVKSRREKPNLSEKL